MILKTDGVDCSTYESMLFEKVYNEWMHYRNRSAHRNQQNSHACIEKTMRLISTAVQLLVTQQLFAAIIAVVIQSSSQILQSMHNSAAEFTRKTTTRLFMLKHTRQLT